METRVLPTAQANSQEGLDVEVVGSEDDLKEHLLVDLCDASETKH